MRDFPEVVLFLAQGRAQAALVLSAREGEPSHLGKNGEPLLTVAVVKQPAPNAPHKRTTSLQAATSVPEFEILHDVVHVSQEFDAEFLRKHGNSPAQIAAQRGHGEWTEFEGDEGETIGRLRESLSSTQSLLVAEEDNSAKEKSRADLAESLVESLRAELAALKAEKPAEPTA